MARAAVSEVRADPLCPCNTQAGRLTAEAGAAGPRACQVPWPCSIGHGTAVTRAPSRLRGSPVSARRPASSACPGRLWHH